jgi:hypothetical protein
LSTALYCICHSFPPLLAFQSFLVTSANKTDLLCWLLKSLENTFSTCYYCQLPHVPKRHAMWYPRLPSSSSWITRPYNLP